MKTLTEVQRELFALLVTEATIEGSMHLHGILGALTDEIKLMQAKLVTCQPSKLTALDRLHACNLADLLTESLMNDMPVDSEHLLVTVDPDAALLDDVRAVQCVRNGLIQIVKGLRN